MSCVITPLWGDSDDSSHNLVIDQIAPSFLLKDFDGNDHSLESYRGQVVYLDFWASWCGPCRESFPALSELYENYKDQGFVILAVNLDENREDADRFVSTYSAQYPLLEAYGTTVPEQFQVEVMPTAYFIDSDGRIRLIHKGFKAAHVDFLEAVLQKLLAEI